MSIDDAIAEMKNKILAVSPGAEIKVVKMSDEEARLSVFAPKGDLEAIKAATLQPAMDYFEQGRVRYSSLCLRQGCAAVERMNPPHPPPPFPNPTCRFWGG